MAAGFDIVAPRKPNMHGWRDIAWHSTAAMLGAGVIGLPYVFACLGWIGGCVLLSLAILVSRDTYMCLVRCYEVPGELFFERRWRHRRARAVARRRRAALAQRLACGGGGSGVEGDAAETTEVSASLPRSLPSGASGPGGALDFEHVDEDEHDTDAVERVRDAVVLVDAETGETLDVAEAEREFCSRRAAAMSAVRRRKRQGGGSGPAPADAADAAADDDDVLEAGKNAASLPPPRTSIALFQEYSALSRWAFGRRLGTWLLTPFQTALIVGICISYQIVGSEALFSIVASSRAMAMQAAAAGTAASSSSSSSSATITADAMNMPKWPFYMGFAALQGAFAVGCGSIAESSAVSFGGVVASVVYCGVASALSLAIVAWRNADPSAQQISYAPKDALYNPAHPATGPNAPGGANLGAVFAALNALGVMIFTYGGHNTSLEVQSAHLVPPPSTIPAMTRGVNVSFLITAIACLWTAATGYAAFGATVGDNILTTISNAAMGASLTGGSAPSSASSPATLVAVRVAIMVAQFAIFAHVIAAYNVYAQVLWASVERLMAERWRQWRAKACPPPAAVAAAPAAPAAVEKRRRAAPALPPAASAMLSRAPLRLLYVVVVLAVALAIPFFGAVAGIVGALCVTPTTFVLPYALEIIRHREYDPEDEGLEGHEGAKMTSSLPRWRRAACWAGGLTTAAIGLAGTAASVYVIVAQLSAKAAAERH
jgi:hypothetical protein